MKPILIACEESQEVCKAFREKGFEAYSCDILDCSGGHPEWHIKGDVLGVIDTENGGHFITQAETPIFIDKWGLIIAHPPCTFLSRAGTRWLYPKGELNKERYEKGLKAKEFFMKLLNANADFKVVENPVPHPIFKMPEFTQAIQPYEYGHPMSKKTLLWIKGLPNLKPTNIVEREYYFDKKGIRHTKLNGWSAKRKSKTFRGIARAMAKQWGDYIKSKEVSAEAGCN